MQYELEESHERADIAESQVNKLRAKSREAGKVTTDDDYVEKSDFLYIKSVKHFKQFFFQSIILFIHFLLFLRLKLKNEDKKLHIQASI